MAGTINSIHRRVSNNTGKKPGKVDGRGYSGPDVAVPDRKF
jgi:hypothetical protein